MNLRRRKVLFVVAWAVFSGTLLSGFWFFDSGDGGDEDKEVAVVEEKLRLVEYVVEVGDTWEKIMEKLGVDWNLGLEYLTVSQSAHNLASIHAGNEFRFLFDKVTEALTGLEYDIDDEEFLIIEKKDGGEFGIDVREIVYDTKKIGRAHV